MEASERPQLALDETADGTVRALDGRIVIRDLTVDDERAAHLVRERQQLGKPAADTVRKAIEIGARVLDSEETAVNVDYVRRELEAGLGDIDRKLGGAIDETAEALAEQLAANFGIERNDSVQAQIKEIVAAETRQHREELLRTLTAEDPSNPLVGMQVRIGKKLVETEERHRAEVELLREAHSRESRAMQLQVAELKENVARLVDRREHDAELAEVEDAGTRKGRTFEELVYLEIDRIAANRGDAAHHVGDTSSESGSKKGDVVIEVDGATGTSSLRIVIEAKNKKLSKNDAWSELNAAMDERDAAFGLLVVAGDDKVPSGLQEVTEYQGNKMIVSLDRDEPDPAGLACAYRYARARALMGAQTDLALDAARVRDSAEQAAAALKRANTIRKALTGVRKGEETARAQLEEMIAEVERCLVAIEALVADAEPE